MKTALRVLWCSVIAIFLCQGGEAKPAPRLNIRGLTIGMTTVAVKRAVGKPQRVYKDSDGDLWSYDLKNGEFLDVLFGPDGATCLVDGEALFAGERQIASVGDTEGRLAKLLGPPSDRLQAPKNTDTIECTWKELTVFFAGGQVFNFTLETPQHRKMRRDKAAMCRFGKCAWSVPP